MTRCRLCRYLHEKEEMRPIYISFNRTLRQVEIFAGVHGTTDDYLCETCISNVKINL